MKKKYLYLYLLLLFSSCNLDIPLEDEASGTEAVANEEAAREILAGAYSTFPKEQYLELSVLAGDFYMTKNIRTSTSEKAIELRRLYNWEVRNIKPSGESLWNSYYSALQKANLSLEVERSKKTESKEWANIRAQALSLKALIYSELLSVFSETYADNNMGVVLRDKFDTERRGRSSAKEVVEEINKLLTEALSLYDKNRRSTNYMDYYACLLLKARLALYIGDYENAIKHAEEIKNDIGYAKNHSSYSQALYAALWGNYATDAKTCPEKLFSFSRDALNFPLVPYYDHDPESDYIAVHEEFDFSEKDYRNNVASISLTIQEKPSKIIGKYRTEVYDREPVDLNVLRLAECYFILAESYLHNNKDIEKSRSILNEFLKYRNADLIPENLSFKEMDKQLIFEKQKEFFGEGLNFFDLKRRKQGVQLYSVEKEKKTSKIEHSDYRFTLPLPLMEIKESDGKVKQNKNWPSI